jgi:predicted nucleic acid-binding protein
MEMMEGNILVDTNILVYSTSGKSPFFVASQNAIKHYLFSNYAIWISRQIVREYLVVKSRLMLDEKKYDELILLKEMNYLLENYLVADEITTTSATLAKLLQKYKIAGKQIHDANIIATCIDNDIANILTNNPNHFIRYIPEGINVISLASFTTSGEGL